ncbi:NAD(P)-dependent oxidoreductase [Actinomadura sediminis]|uniref:NAD(P)-dependent oxidoreductase n=1 Tax=Actinomadura sediminis TaxID=1038904 RepID=A0ABW3EU71_9ACTN
MTDMRARVAVLGMGEMGRALAGALVGAGRPVAVWNRTPGKADALVGRGAVEVGVRDAVTAGLVVVCLYDHASVHETLDPVADGLRGRTVVNLTTTTPDEARELAKWADAHGIAYLDGAIMATPPMIGAPGARILYSGSREVFEEHRELFGLWADATYDGADAGMASLFDLAMLAGMYPLFAGFMHGAAMLQSAGVTAAEFATRAAPFLAAMTGVFPQIAQIVDGGDYRGPGQSLDWTVAALDAIARASREQGVEPVPIDMVRGLVRRQIEDGHGAEDFDRIIEGMRAAT